MSTWQKTGGCDMSLAQPPQHTAANGGYAADWLSNPASNVASDGSSYIYAESPGAYVYGQTVATATERMPMDTDAWRRISRS